MPTAEAQAEGRRIACNWALVALSFGINHGAVTAVLAYATSDFGSLLGNWASGILYLCYGIAALLLSTALVRAKGPKFGLASGLFVYSGYVGSSLMAAALPSATWPIFIIGSAAGGLGAGWLWTSQGTILALSAERYAEFLQLTSEQASTKLAGLFGVIYVSTEVACKGLAALIRQEWNTESSMIVMTALAFLSSFLALGIRDMQEPPEVLGSEASGVSVVLLAWRFIVKEPRMQLIFPFALARGMGGTLESYYLNGVIVSESMGSANIGYFSAVPVLVAFALAGPVTYAAGEVGKLPLMCYSLVSQIMTSSVIFVLSESELISLEWQIGFLYIMNGVTLVIETCLYRAICVDFFPGEHAEGFASFVIADAIGTTIPLALFPFFSKNLMAGSTWVCSFVAIAALVYSYRIQDDPERKKLRSSIAIR